MSRHTLSIVMLIYICVFKATRTLGTVPINNTIQNNPNTVAFNCVFMCKCITVSSTKMLCSFFSSWSKIVGPQPCSVSAPDDAETT